VGLAEVLSEHASEVVRTVEVISTSGSHPDAPVVYDADALGAFDAVVVGLTRDFDYAQLDLVSQVVRGGACLLATNSDATFPAADRIQPGTGSLLAAVEAACGVKATVAGKPEPPMARLIGASLGSGSTKGLVVGDRPDTDGRLAQQLGLPFALVLSGVTEAYSFSLEVPVAVVAEDLAALVSGEVLAGDTRVTSTAGASASVPGSPVGKSPVRR
jgi:ribonucleotide monophosphatase NagD (HAD superfamily)